MTITVIRITTTEKAPPEPCASGITDDWSHLNRWQMPRLTGAPPGHVYGDGVPLQANPEEPGVVYEILDMDSYGLLFRKQEVFVLLLPPSSIPVTHRYRFLCSPDRFPVICRKERLFECARVVLRKYHCSLTIRSGFYGYLAIVEGKKFRGAFFLKGQTFTLL